jgi:hypothetical protein
MGNVSAAVAAVKSAALRRAFRYFLLETIWFGLERECFFSKRSLAPGQI